VSGPQVTVRRTALPVARLAGYRKLAAFAVVAICATVLQALGKFDAVIASFLGGTFLTYAGANVREHAHRAAAARAGLDEAPGASSLPPLPGRPAPARPGAPAPFDEREPGDDTAFDPERPAVDRDTLVNLLADMMAERMGGRATGQPGRSR
jgi:hypothetical protein